MKKLVLIAGLVIMSFSLSAQTRHVTGNISNDDRLPWPATAVPDGVLLNGSTRIPGEKVLSYDIIGNTWYDTQTYNSGNLMNRVHEFPDGTVGATWMHQGYNQVPDRGSAYNYFDGSAWQGQTPHLGTDTRTGHPCYQPWGPNGEIIAHYKYAANDGVIKLLRRETKGTGPWLETVLSPPIGNYSLVWHSMMTSGPNHEYIHILALVYDDPYMGLDDALLYYRSSDGGVTWEISEKVIDGLTSTYFTSISSLKYAWANPVGNTIAFTYGFDHFDGLVFKSTDNGDNWEKITVYEAPYTPFNLPPDVTPTFGGGDGSSAIALDSQGKVHVAFGRMRHIYDVVSTPPGGWYFYPVTEGIVYWNESMPTLDSTTVSSYTLEFLEEGGNLVGWVVPDTTIDISNDQPNYGVGLTTGPMFGIDGQDNLYLSWAALAPEYNNGQYFFRHVFSNASEDGGTTWNGIQDLTGNFIFFMSECVYPAINPIVGQKVHLVFQEDYTPGTGSGEENYIDYIDFNKDFFVGIPETGGNADFTVSQNYPNPASGSTTFRLTIPDAGNVSVEILNPMGQTLQTKSCGMLDRGSHDISLDLTGLACGIYFYAVTVDGQTTTKKVTIAGR